MVTLYAQRRARRGKTVPCVKFREGRNEYVLNDKITYIQPLEDLYLSSSGKAGVLHWDELSKHSLKPLRA